MLRLRRVAGAPRRRGERGSVAVAVIVMVVMAALGAALVERSMADARRQRDLMVRDQLATALDAGGAAVVARISAGESAGSFTDTGIADGFTWSATAARVAADQWDVVVDASQGPRARSAAFSVRRNASNQWTLRSWVESTRPIPTTTTSPPTTAPPSISPMDYVEYLVVGGGGGGAAYTGGGGGAGGFRTNVGGAFLRLSVLTYPVVVGAGGIGGPPGTYASQATNGQPSRFDTVVAAGGGGGGENWTTGADGGSGGGSGHVPSAAGAGIAGQGNPGGYGPTSAPNYGAGGGGGAGSAGGRSSNTAGGVGGSGRYSAITGAFYAAGGGGGSYNNGPVVLGGRGGGGNGGGATAGPTDGAPASGSGGGGQRNNVTAGGGNGGSGIVIVRYPGPPAAVGGTILTLGGYTMHVYNTPGAYTFEPDPPPGSPGAPTGVALVAADRQLQVTWSPPASSGSGPILTSTATAEPGGFTCAATAPATSCGITGLVNGSTYLVTVRATNAAGTGRASAPPAVGTPGWVPGAPLAPSVLAGNQSVGVSFAAPPDNGSSIIDYLVTASPGGASAVTTTTSVAVGGLTNGTSYTFTVRARNAFGLGPASSASVPATPTTSMAVEYLVVGGGGGGAAYTGGGGGAGGLLTNVGSTPFAVSSGSYVVNVGAGGVGGPPGTYASKATNGASSRFSSIVALGGGGGGENWTTGADGGSGGGSGHVPSAAGAGTSGQGNPGGYGPTGSPNYGAGGGGGAGGAGGRSSNTAGGAGGPGLLSPMTGQTYAGGGGGGTYNNGPVAPGGVGGGGSGGGVTAGPTDGTPNTGGGGGGQRNNVTAGGGSGGSGIVIIRYPGAPIATGGTILSANGYTLHVFTVVGAWSFVVP